MKAARKAKERRVTRVKAETERDIITDSESVIEVGVGSGSLGSKIRWGADIYGTSNARGLLLLAGQRTAKAR